MTFFHFFLVSYESARQYVLQHRVFGPALYKGSRLLEKPLPFVPQRSTSTPVTSSTDESVGISTERVVPVGPSLPECAQSGASSSIPPSTETGALKRFHGK